MIVSSFQVYMIYFLLGFVILIESVAIYSTHPLIYAVFLITYVIITIFVAFDCYYVGVGRIDRLLAVQFGKNIFCIKPQTDDNR